jgi:hypothetical protein
LFQRDRSSIANYTYGPVLSTAECTLLRWLLLYLAFTGPRGWVLGLRAHNTVHELYPTYAVSWKHLSLRLIHEAAELEVTEARGA